jgi:hypothetical protein
LVLFLFKDENKNSWTQLWFFWFILGLGDEVLDLVRKPAATKP